MKHKIHIFGASGSGTTTIAKTICERLAYKHFDSDDFFWLQGGHQPFTVERPRDECLQLMKDALSECESWILSGSLCGWADILVPYFDLVVFVYVPQDIRLERLRKREFAQYGDRILPGGDRFEASKNFLEWAAAYDAGTKTGRSLPKHEALLETVNCPVLRIINQDLEESIERVINFIME